MDKRKIIQEYVMQRYARDRQAAITRGRRLLLAYFAAVGAISLGRGCIYLWYWLEYDLNIFDPVPTDYLKQRLR